MLRRVEAEENVAAFGLPAVAGSPEVAVPAVAEAELETTPLPHDHPRWVRDSVAVSKAARELVARLRPIAIRVLSVWDHHLRSIVVGNRRVHVDPAGSYWTLR